jgi:hypothetical protein
LISCFALRVASGRSDSLLLVLDKTIKDKSLYSNKREHRIDSMKTLLNSIIDPEQRYAIYQELYREYKRYNMNSALSVSEQKLLIAQELNSPSLVSTSEMNVAEIMSIMGMYKEALDIVDAMNPRTTDTAQRLYYFHIYHSLYSLMSENSTSQKERNRYDKLTGEYKDSLLSLIDKKSLGYEVIRSGKLIEEERYDEALLVMNPCYEKHKNDDSQLRIVAYVLSDIHARMGEHEKEKEYLAISATADLRMAIKEYIALRKLAVLLYREGEINRAYDYIKCSMDDASFCGARFRILEISETLPIITSAYDRKIRQEREKLLKYLILISVLSVVLLTSVVFICKQLKSLSRAKESIKNMYEDMKAMNKNLDELNKILSESNHVKEEYIGSVFNLCSNYINKMESYRINLHRSLISNRMDEARRMTGSSLVQDELKEFFRHFDAIFLNIYPNFIDEFNSLLKDGEQITPKADDILTPELRIFALIRLGITDGNKIAQFLHYSPQTVYNYKLKIRNKLSISKDEFDLAIRQTGKIDR